PSPSTENQPTNLNPEITAYSFDRAIVCDSAEIAQFLIANNFHFENNCAVLSIDGYPQNIFSTVMEMLRRNPELKVYAIHDASPHGISLVNQLRTNSNWFANSSATVYDLGLSPRQVLRSRSLFIRNSSESKQRAARSPQSVKQELSPDELEWLEKGNFVELESLMPRRLLQVLTRGIALSQAPDVEDALIPVESDGGLVFATDSFG
ncbi:MAG: MFS transporter permease, partial [Cyanobacteriota bacterium]|nr:MFS transporter permease [Cyanobacteriota bacterium]